MPYHNHNILYNGGTGADGGIWGKNSINSGNFGAPSGNGYSGYATTQAVGGNTPVYLTIPSPPSYTINYYIYAGYSG